MSNILETYSGLQQIKTMSVEDMEDFANEIRMFLIDKVSKTGGHLASNLGVVELTLSLYKIFDFDVDKLIWDVGHQSYVHKILTGRKDKFDTLRQFGGMSGFPKRSESIYDMFETGHSSTSISAALGMARARDIDNENYNVVSVIGDGALTGGMALEALNDVGDRKTKIIIILNDNQMSINKNVGGLSLYLNKIRLGPRYNKLKKKISYKLDKTYIGREVANSIRKVKGGIKQFVVPGMVFEDMGIKYLGPIDGHNIRDLCKAMSMAKNFNQPVLIHAITKKGKGYDYAENYPDIFHGVGPFDYTSGELCTTSTITYSKVLGDELVKLANDNKKIVAITAAMSDGTGLKEFSYKYPERFFDVGIAEQHATTMAAGMAQSGFKPVFAVYSTFLQRAYDQVLHDICIQNLPVILAVDRAGIVGADGETHQGVFDLSYLSHMPNMTIMSPKCMEELRVMLRWAINQNFPIAIRYPRGGDMSDIKISPIKYIEKGKWEILYEEGDIAIIAQGRMLQHAISAKKKLNKMGIHVSIINACFIKPIDKSMLDYLAYKNYNIITIEDNIIHGGLGTMVLEYLNSINYKNNIKLLGFKDEFIPHGSTDKLYKFYGLDVDSIVNNIIDIYKKSTEGNYIKCRM